MRFILRIFGWLFAAGAIAFVVGAAVAGGVIWHYSQDLPDYAQLRNYEPPVMTRVHAGDGSLIAEYARERRLYIPIQAVPKLVVDAYISAEDKNFYKHIGVDPEGLVRAAISNFRNKGTNRRQQGASTITQQVAKNFFLSPEQSYERKIREALVALEPALGPKAAKGALYGGGCHVSDPKALTLDLGRVAIERGARLLTMEVVAVKPQADAVALVTGMDSLALYDRVVIAAGAWSKPLAASVGDAVPLDTERGYNVTLPAGQLGLTRPVMYEGQGFVTTPLDSGDRIGGSVEFAGLEAPPNYARVDAILGRARRFLPEADLSGGTRWMGFRPSIPDSLPVISTASRDPRIVHAFGHGHYGLTQAAASAEIVADLVAGRAPSIDPAPYSVTRFARRF